MKKSTLTIIIIIIVLALLWWLKPKKDNQPNQNAGKPNTPSPAQRVKGIIAKPEKINEKIISTGTILANDEVELRTETAGIISAIYFKEGSNVRKGQLLVKINDLELQAQLEKQQAQKKLIQDKTSRQKKLLEIKAISQEEYDIASNELTSVSAELKFLQSQIAKTEIRAPFDGVIGLKYVSEGSYVTSATKIALVQDMDPVKIDFTVPEKYLNKINKSEQISFRIADQDKSFSGKIYAIEPKVDPVNRNVQIRAISENKEGKIFPGSFASVELNLHEIPNALMVPTQCIVPELKGQKVFVCKNGKAMPQKVETGIRTESSIEITKGIEPGDTVITSGIMQLKPEAPVKVSIK
jgi:membrane fusion protein, multidrug efflux system